MELREWVNEHYLEASEQERLRHDFSSFGARHVVMDDFLQEDVARRILEEVKKGDLLVRNNPETTGIKKDVFLKRGGFVDEYEGFVRSPKYQELLARISGVDVKGFETLFATRYDEGCYLIAHSDAEESRSVRCIIFLSDLEEDDGGQLVLSHGPTSENREKDASIAPKFNRAVLIEIAAESYHEVTPLTREKTRYNIVSSYV